jgi:hypothetical protein
MGKGKGALNEDRGGRRVGGQRRVATKLGYGNGDGLANSTPQTSSFYFIRM